MFDQPIKRQEVPQFVRNYWVELNTPQKRELLNHRAEVIGRSIGCGPARRLLRLQPFLLVPGYRGHLHTSPRIWQAHPGAVVGMMQHGRQKFKIFGRRFLSTAQLVKCYINLC